jgi:hypothetical protein
LAWLAGLLACFLLLATVRLSVAGRVAALAIVVVGVLVLMARQANGI